MPLPVIDFLEAVHVNCNDCGDILRMLFEIGIIALSVQQLCQRIGFRELLEQKVIIEQHVNCKGIGHPFGGIVNLNQRREKADDR